MTAAPSTGRSWARQLVPTSPLLMAWFAAGIVLNDRFFLFEGQRAWLAWGIVAAVLVGAAATSTVVPRWRQALQQSAAVQHALRTRTDPGPELRTRVDQQAGYVTRTWWVVWCYPVVVFAYVPRDLGRPPAVVLLAGVVLVAITAAAAVHQRRQVGAAHRWVADPPGPLRPPPPPRPVGRWLTGKRLALAVVVLILLAAGLGLGLALLGG